ncbi:hypothetical protein chiPu_0011828 [Chiloscyllium punctatum]|uniref:Uncharacterized protein n=1 Tax=Chiloscyllium punctatum TaxID=137246 RepID=A0A401SSI5_CHIPU|nr:hypothetical protein [Chiloscyllium punctatum]
MSPSGSSLECCNFYFTPPFKLCLRWQVLAQAERRIPTYWALRTRGKKLEGERPPVTKATDCAGIDVASPHQAGWPNDWSTRLSCSRPTPTDAARATARGTRVLEGA